MTSFLKAALLAVGIGSALGVAPTPTAAAQLAQPAQKPPAHPYTKRHLYDESIDPRVDIKAGLAKAKAEHKRLLLDFGGDWCGDCQVLDIYFHQAPNEELLAKHFVVVHVFIPSHYERNTEIPAEYGVPIHNGVPALAVLDSHGKVLFSQKTGEFRDMRYMDAPSVTEFLNRWKG